MNAARRILTLLAALVPAACVVTFGHPIGHHYLEFEGEYAIGQLAADVKGFLEKRGLQQVEIQAPGPRAEDPDPRFARAYVQYATTHNDQEYHHIVFINCASLCGSRGAIRCPDLRCAISAGANEETLGAEYVEALLADLEQTLGVPTDYRGPPRREVETD